jgi:hypothetical protein
MTNRYTDESALWSGCASQSQNEGVKSNLLNRFLFVGLATGKPMSKSLRYSGYAQRVRSTLISSATPFCASPDVEKMNEEIDGKSVAR